MNTAEEKMFLILKELKDKNKELIVKADFEAEGTRIFELASLAKLVFRAGGKLFIKIAGAEAILDLEISKAFGADGIMVPMVETAYYLKKFKFAAKKVFGDEIEKIDWIINTETKMCVENIEEILKEGRGFLKGVTIGRVDLCSSVGLERKDIDCLEILELTKILAEKAYKKGFLVSVGGGILKTSFSILSEIKQYLNRYETRKFIFNFDGDLKKFEKNIEKATEFELLFLENKSLRYSKMAKEDLKRIEFLKERL